MAVEYIRNLHEPEKSRIQQTISLLELNQRKGKKPKGVEAYSLRVGSYRILYQSKDRIYIIAIEHRKDIYRRY